MRQSIKGGRCMALNQYYKYKMVDKTFRTTSEELISKGKVGEVIEAFAEYMTKE